MVSRIVSATAPTRVTCRESERERARERERERERGAFLSVRKIQRDRIYPKAKIPAGESGTRYFTPRPPLYAVSCKKEDKYNALIRS